MIPKRILFENDEPLAGTVQGKKASDIEERWARACSKLPDWSYSFRIRINPLSGQLTEVMMNLPGELEIDFLMQRGSTILPILIQGEIGHFYTAWQATTDEMKQAGINNALRAYSAQPALPVPRTKDELWRLSKQEYADALAREILA